MIRWKNSCKTLRKKSVTFRYQVYVGHYYYYIYLYTQNTDSATIYWMLPRATWYVIKRNHAVCALVEFIAQMGILTLNKQTQKCI